jgi:ferric-dicitrate binding protein FerR (iron transport regulator)
MDVGNGSSNGSKNGNGQDRPICREHVTVMQSMTQVTTILEQVRDSIAEVCRKFDAHTDLEGHPLLALRVRNLEERHERNMRAMDQLEEGLRQTGETVRLMQLEQKSRSEDRRVALDTKTKVLAAGLALCGTLGGALIALLKH